MKKSNFILMAIAVMVITALSSSARDSVAQQSAEAVECSCSAWNGKGCRADYWGSTCAPGNDCVSYDRNCSNPGAPTP